MLRIRKLELFLFVSVVIFGAGAAIGQKINISTLQNKKSALTDEEKGQVADWISSQFGKISEELDKPITKKNTLKIRKKNLNKIRDTLKRTSKGSNFFRSAFFESLGKKIISNASDSNLKTAAIEVVLLSEFDDPAIINIYHKLLRVREPAIQLLAVKGLTVRSGRIPSSDRKQIIDDIKGLAEQSNQDVIPGCCYSFFGKIDSAQSRQALLEILKLRTKAYVDGQASQFYDDRKLAEIIINIYEKVGEDARKQIVSSLKDIFKSAVGIVVTESIALPEIRMQVDLLIYTIEKGLSSITGKNSDLPVVSALKEAKLDEAKKLLDKWK